MRRTRVLVVDGETMYRESICAVLSDRQDIEIVGRATSMNDLIQMARECRPHVVLLEPGADETGLEWVAGLFDGQSPPLKVLLVSQYEDEAHVLGGLLSGCQGYIPKRANASELVSAIQALRRGGYYLYPSAAKIVINECVSRSRGMQTDSRKEVYPNGRKRV
ncbi:MAG: hypothetical protein A2147_05450 [Chloroflexi bacterium RBG_16_57_8]|nr:MAG: hypothetical protein A2147_05450 [Chloroflexi bacterium RBG_16_57_8]